MKTKFLIISFLTFSRIAFSQIPQWLWANSAVGTASDYGQSITVDASGNSYATGYFNSPTMAFGTTTLTNIGAANIFIVKYDPSGNVLWANSAGGTSAMVSKGISIDLSGNVYITGFFYGDSVSFGTTILTNKDTTGLTSDIFVAKYSSLGNFLWAKVAGGISEDYSYSISANPIGNISITGYFYSDTISFGTLNGLNSNNTFNTTDIFVANYNPSGNIQWLNTEGGTSDEVSLGVSTDAGGNVFVTGSFESPFIAFGTTTLTNVVSADIFIAKFTSLGNPVWAKSAGGPLYDEGTSVSTFTNGNVCITGYFASASINFGLGPLNNVGPFSADIFVVCYDATGNNLWSNSLGGVANDFGFGISNDASGNTYVTGYFDSPSISVGTNTLTTIGPSDIIILKYNSSGNLVWGLSAGGTSSDRAFSIAIDAVGNIYATGYYASPSIAFGTTILTNSGTANFFIFKLYVNPADINQFEKPSFPISIFPNPTMGPLNIIAGEKSRNATISIVNTFGEVILKEYIINLNSLTLNIIAPPGIYFLVLDNEKGQRNVAKFIKD